MIYETNISSYFHSGVDTLEHSCPMAQEDSPRGNFLHHCYRDGDFSYPGQSRRLAAPKLRDSLASFLELC
jgi:hypothetical protein